MDSKTLGDLMNSIEEMMEQIPIEQLRLWVMTAETNKSPELAAKFQALAPPGAPSFHHHTQRARRWLDFLDDLHALDEEANEDIAER